MYSPQHHLGAFLLACKHVARRRAGKHHAFLAVCRQRHSGIIPHRLIQSQPRGVLKNELFSTFGVPRSRGPRGETPNAFRGLQTKEIGIRLGGKLAIVLRRRCCLITSPPQDGFAVANLRRHGIDFDERYIWD